jgi:hypothetical protein
LKRFLPPEIPVLALNFFHHCDRGVKIPGISYEQRARNRDFFGRFSGLRLTRSDPQLPLAVDVTAIAEASDHFPLGWEYFGIYDVFRSPKLLEFEHTVFDFDLYVVASGNIGM